MVKERNKRVAPKSQLRGLTQYRDLTDEEFDAVYDEMVTGYKTSSEFERRIQRKIDDFSKDYDLSDLKMNDLLTLRALAQAFITLEDFERYSHAIRQEGLQDVDIVRIEKLNNILSNLRKDISNLQNDLKITRKIRKGDNEESVINFIEDLKIKARRFYESKMKIVLCPKCGTWIASVWLLYPNDNKTKFRFRCNRKFPDGKICGEVFELSAEELSKKSDKIPASL